ncbi:MAG: sugar ABC transporter ATP-binding protein, partial [Microbacteriaceae bacterium]|nr:sugar ABC transporter ATP-binding protein [Microbacteriaceae bacterium]
VTGVKAGEAETGRVGRAHGDVVLEIENLSGGGIEDIDLKLRAGEVVGIAGVLGSGREALPALVFGSLESEADKFVLGGSDYVKRSPRASIRRGMGFVPGDRAKLGSIRPMNARENTTLPELKSLTNGAGAVSVKKEREHVMGLVAQYDVKPPRPEQMFSQFSGGNQQKVVFAKWLRNNPRVLLLEEPTQGVDIGAKQALYGAVDAAAESGSGVIVCSSEAKELVRLCDRVLVLRGGRVAAELSGEELTETAVVLAGYGLKSEAEL